MRELICLSIFYFILLQPEVTISCKETVTLHICYILNTHHFKKSSAKAVVDLVNNRSPGNKKAAVQELAHNRPLLRKQEIVSYKQIIRRMFATDRLQSCRREGGSRNKFRRNRDGGLTQDSTWQDF